MEHVGRGASPCLVQQVNQSTVIDGEADTLGVNLGVLDGDQVFNLHLNPGPVQEQPAGGVEQGQLGGAGGEGEAGVLPGVP